MSVEKKEVKKAIIYFRATTDIHEWLKAQSLKTKRTMSDYVYEIIKATMDKHE